MKLLVQKVARATVEVDGLIECRIGNGLVLNVGVTKGSTTEDARRLAEKVIKLKLYPDVADQDAPCKSSVMDTGNELLVVLQQTLCTSFPWFEPRDQGAADLAEAKQVLETFTKYLQTEYQEEMIVAAPADPGMKVEALCEGVYELDSDTLGKSAKPVVTKAAVVKSQDNALVELEPEVAFVSKAMRQLSLHSKTKATLESCRIFRVLSMRKFRAALSEANQAESDAFAEALEGSAKYFSAKQLEQIMSWTGLTIMAPPRDDAADAKEEEEEDEFYGADEGADDLGGGDLEDQLAQLQEEIDDPEAARKRKRATAAAQKAAKEEAAAAEADAAIARHRPDWKGRAAPETPAAAAARMWVQSRAGARQQWSQGGSHKGGKGGKGWGKSGPRPWRSLGIASLDTSSRLHGAGTAGYAYGQLNKHGDVGNKYLGKEEPAYEEGDEEEGHPAKKRGTAPPPRRPKGTPTLAPMTPAPGEVQEEL